MFKTKVTRILITNRVYEHCSVLHSHRLLKATCWPIKAINVRNTEAKQLVELIEDGNLLRGFV